MNRRLLILIGLLAMLSSPGCGTKGPLTLPQDAGTTPDQTDSGKKE
ncbi:MAG: lipopeptide [Chromatiaceae bacterium]|nr:lipopeptide [Gammaproteobacteria bacterium]MCP5318493.1 lipopeptide [Chromatiaceae bacterium]MCW5587036.1 hypothetical protein [Chromatiales bacterium]HOP15289.1 lipopeptide [Gammaproteobacteria bacterium]HPQ24195.1 lipopeptide [Gammaproteobacteria bacterium]